MNLHVFSDGLPEAFRDTILDAGPDAPFKNNVSAYLALKALQRPDGVHNRKQRRALAQATRRALGKQTIRQMEGLVRTLRGPKPPTTPETAPTPATP